jgi:hypothetical protein
MEKNPKKQRKIKFQFVGLARRGLSEAERELEQSSISWLVLSEAMKTKAFITVWMAHDAPMSIKQTSLKTNNRN